MNSDTLLQVTHRDVALVRRTLRHLTATQKLISAVAIVITALAWWFVLKRLLVFGQGIDYSGLHALGAQTVTLLQHYNPFFWWGIIILITLLIIYILYGFIARAHRRVQRKLVTRAVVEQLATQLSEAGREVLNWVWQDRRNPVTVGVLQHTLAEMRSDRASKITLARQHDALLRTPQDPAPTRKTVAIPPEI